MGTKTQTKIYINNEDEVAGNLHVEFRKNSGVKKVVSADQEDKVFKKTGIEGKTVDFSGGTVAREGEVTVKFTVECENEKDCDPDQQDWHWTKQEKRGEKRQSQQQKSSRQRLR